MKRLFRRKESVVPYCKDTVRHFSAIVKPSKRIDYEFKNEPILQYLKGSKEMKALKPVLDKFSTNVEEIPVVIGDKEYRTGNTYYQVMPHNHKKKIAKVHMADEKLMSKAIEVATKTQKEWDMVPHADRMKLWLKAADLMATKYRPHLCATTMIGQSKTVVQAEIDAACELIDFFRNSPYYLNEALKYQPLSPEPKKTINSMRYRGFDGFIAAISPFNFTAIGGNLSFTPALMGNSVLWKPAETATLSNWYIFKVCREAGIPPGVVNFVPAKGPHFGSFVLASPHLSGVSFTGSLKTFYWIWKKVGSNVEAYKNFPRIIGEVGGKNFHFIHSSADIESVVAGTVRSAYEYCGQKCSALSRMYCCESLWPKIKENLIEETKKLTYGDVSDVKTFLGAVIDKNSFENIRKYINYAKKSSELDILFGGNSDDSVGYFIEPTLILSTDPKSKLMTEEIFGPVLTVYVFKDKDMEAALELVDTSTEYSLTGAIYANDRKFLEHAVKVLKMATGNLYINDKSTGSVVGQQPFGGARKSGTNDKAGGPHFVLRWGNPLAVKETFVPTRDITYPYMEG